MVNPEARRRGASEAYGGGTLGLVTAASIWWVWLIDLLPAAVIVGGRLAATRAGGAATLDALAGQAAAVMDQSTDPQGLAEPREAEVGDHALHLTAEAHWESIETRWRDPRASRRSAVAVSKAPRRPSRRTRGEWDELIDGLVWLTSNPDSVQGWQAGGPKGAVRITLKTDRAVRWTRFAAGRGVPEEYLRALRRSGGDPSEWFVSDSPVPRAEWLRVEETATGTLLYSRRSS